MAAVIIDKSDLAALNITLQTLKKESPVAIVKATNDAMKGIKTQSAKLIGEKVTASAARIKEHFKINLMRVTDMSADIECKGDPLPLIYYSTSHTAKGVTVKVLKKGGRKLVKHAFPVKFKSGKKHIVWREERVAGKGSKRFLPGKKTKLPSPTGPKRKKGDPSTFQLPLTIRYGPRIPDIYDDNDIIIPVLADASVRFDDRLKYHTGQLINKAR